MIQKIYNLLRYIVFLPAFAILFAALNPNPDSFFLITTGRYILQNGIPEMNPFIHMDAHITIQQWLICILNAFIYDNFGYNGMLIYSLAILIITAIVVTIYCKVFNKNERTIRICVLFVTAASFSFMTTRPSSITIILTLFELAALEKFYQTNKSAWLIVLPIISCIQINVHAAMWFTLFPFLFIYFMPQKIGKKLFDVRQIKLFITFVLMFIAGFINPNGKESVFYILNSVGGVKNLPIQEMQKPVIFGYNGILAVIGIVLFTIYIYKFKKEIDLHIAFIGFVGIIYSMLYVRNAYYVSICMIGVIASIFTKEKVSTKTNKECLAGSAVFIALIITILAIFPMNVELKDKESSPVEAFDYLDTKDNVVLFTGFNSGSYGEFRGYKVYLDGRAEIFGKNITKTEDYMEEYLKVYSGVVDYDKFIEKYGFTHLIVGCETDLNIYLKYNDNYKLVVDHNDYKLYEKIN